MIKFNLNDVTIQEILSQQLEPCRECNCKRIRIEKDSIPVEIKNKFPKIGKIDYYLYCKECKSYSVIGDF
ncbi:MAG: hypothetical protein HXX18_06330 [Bacteroidetes bacterium]|nr:hypothetical protein [Bacteroidota bacterium]